MQLECEQRIEEFQALAIVCAFQNIGDKDKMAACFCLKCGELLPYFVKDCHNDEDYKEDIAQWTKFVNETCWEGNAIILHTETIIYAVR